MKNSLKEIKKQGKEEAVEVKFQCFTPDIIKQIQIQNLEFMRDRLFLDPEYFNFLYEFVKLN